MIITVNGYDFKVTKKLANEIKHLILESQMYAYLMEKDSENELNKKIYKDLGSQRNKEWLKIQEELKK